MLKVRYMPPQSGNGDWPKGYWDVVIFMGPLQIRIGNSQFAIWWHRGGYRFVTIVNLLYGHFRRPAQRS